jgi:hypothetical protein
MITRRKRHSVAEISAKLAKAGEWSAQGRTQSEIAEGLGISVMTYHRWRKLSNNQVVSAANVARGRDEPDRSRPSGYVAELKLENSRLRRLVADLLLQNVELVEAAGVNAPQHDTRTSLARGAVRG